MGVRVLAAGKQVASHGLAGVVTVAVWVLLPMSLWTAGYLALWVLAASTGAGMGSPLVLPLGWLIFGVAFGALAAVICAVGLAGDIVRQWLGLSVVSVPAAIGSVSALVSLTASLSAGAGALASLGEAALVALVVVAGSATYWVPLLASGRALRRAPDGWS